MRNQLVAYFSASGVTRQVSETLAEVVDADLYEIRPEQQYTRLDLDWRNPQSRSSIEMKDVTSRPKMVDCELALDHYKVIYLGFPIWWYEAPRIIHTFLEKGDFHDKKIILFATSGGSDFGETLNKLKEICPQANFVEGKVFHTYSKDEMLQWALNQK